MYFYGYPRKNGLVGIRNYYLMLGMCDALEGIMRNIASKFDDVLYAVSAHGCPAAGNEQVVNNFIGLANNPNVVGVLVMGVGCEGVRPETVASQIDGWKPVEIIKTVNEKGTRNTIEKGIDIINKMKAAMGENQREKTDIGKLTIALKCGGSDTTSGIASNASVGAAIDKLVDLGVKAVFTEPIECIGGEKELFSRAETPEVEQKLREALSLEDKRWNVPECEVEFMCIGNVAGGLTTIEEKSIGAIHKSGSRPIVGVLENSDKLLECPKAPGVYLQEGTMLFSHCLTHLAAAGCQLCLFTTGIGASVNSQIMPTIRICGNPSSYADMEEDMDINAGTIISENESIDSVSDRIINMIVDVASGKNTKLEGLGYCGFSIYKNDERLEHFIKKYI